MKNHLLVRKFRLGPFGPYRWAVLDPRQGHTAVSYHRTHADAIHAAHYWATRYANTRAEQIAAGPARHHTPSPA